LLGTCAACSAIGGVVFMLLGQAVIDSLGWRAAYLVYAAIILVVCVPAVLILVRDYPSDCGLMPFGASEAVSDEALAGVQEEAPKASTEEIADMERRVRALMFTPSFALLLLAGFLMNMVCQVNGYLPKFVYWVDDQAALGLMPAAFIAGVVLSSLTQAGSAVGKFFLGAFSDFSTRSALVVLCSSGAAGIACVWLFPSSPLVIIGAFVFGFFLAAILVLVPMLVRSIFGGGELYPMLYARVAVTPAIGGAAANVVWPWMADNLGGFDPVFGVALIMMAVILASSLLALRLQPTE
jgi:MFS family permease